MGNPPWAGGIVVLQPTRTTANTTPEPHTPMEINAGNGSQRLGSTVGGAPLDAGNTANDRAPEHGGIHDRNAGETQGCDPRRKGKRKRKRLTKGRVKIGTLNMRGGGGAGQAGVAEKWLQVNQIVREGRISILALQETHIMESKLEAINDLFKATMHVVATPDPENPTAARGVAVALNKRLIQTDSIEAREIVPGRALEVRLQWTREKKLTLLAVYAPNDMAENAQFWEDLTRARDTGQMHAPDIMLGDMNVVRTPLDRLPPRPDSATAVESLMQLERQLHLVDGWRSDNPNRRDYTYLQASTGSQSRIDRILIKQSLLPQTGNWEIGGSGIATDHRMPTVSLANHQAPHLGHGRWALPTSLLTDTKYLHTMKDMGMELSKKLEQTTRSETENPQMAFATFKENLLKAARLHAKEKMPKLDKRIAALKMDIETTLQRADLADEDIRTVAIMRDELANLEIKRFGTHRERVAANDWVQGETICKYWTRLNAGPRPTTVIQELVVPEANAQANV